MMADSYRKTVYVHLKEGKTIEEIKAKKYEEYKKHADFFGVLDDQSNIILDEISNQSYKKSQLISDGLYDIINIDGKEMGGWLQSQKDIVYFMRPCKVIQFAVYKDKGYLGRFSGYIRSLEKSGNQFIREPEKLFDALSFVCTDKLKEASYEYIDADSNKFDFTKEVYYGSYSASLSVSSLISGFKGGNYECSATSDESENNVVRLDIRTASEDSGQLTLEQCVQEMEDYLQTGTLNDDVIIWMAQNGSAIVNKFGSGQFYNHSNDTTFHDEILAWTNFWNHRITNYSVNPYPNKTLIRANVVKAIIAQESSMGTWTSKNLTRNVMGCLFAGDPTLWIASAINPLVSGKYHLNASGQPAITVRFLDKKTTEPDGTLIDSYDANETRSYRFGTGLRLLDPVILTTGGGSSGNEYLIEYSAMSVRMGIAIGVGTLAYKINVAAGGSEKNGVMSYGTGAGYDVVINQHLSELGAGLLVV